MPPFVWETVSRAKRDNSVCDMTSELRIWPRIARDKLVLNYVRPFTTLKLNIISVFEVYCNIGIFPQHHNFQISGPIQSRSFAPRLYLIVSLVPSLAPQQFLSNPCFNCCGAGEMLELNSTSKFRIETGAHRFYLVLT